MSKIVLDTSVIINGQIRNKVEDKTITDTEIIIPVAVLDELQSEASQKKEQGFTGLNELKKLQSISKQHGNVIKFEGTTTMGCPLIVPPVFNIFKTDSNSFVSTFRTSLSASNPFAIEFARLSKVSTLTLRSAARIIV